MRLNHRRKLADAAARQQRRCETGEIVHRQVRLKGDGFLAVSVFVQKGPACLGPAAPEREQPVVEQILGRFGRLQVFRYVRAGDELASIGQDFPSDQ